MERIAWRAVVAVAILGVVLGIPAMYFGHNGHKSMQERWLEESKLADVRHKACIAEARGNDVEESICWSTWSAEDSSNSWMMVASSRSMNTFMAGFLMTVVLPGLLFPVFFVVRWICTGRWKRKLPS